MNNQVDVRRMTNEEFKQFTKGQWFSVTFEKQNKELRTYKTCRTDVKKYTKGGINNVETNRPNMVTVWPKELKDQYRTLNLETVKEFKFQGKVWEY